MSKKPKIFIASSAESLKEAEAVHSILDHQYEVSLWTEGTFRLSSTVLNDLITKSSYMDFAIFLFTPNDLALIRDEKQKIVRDNVVFELGLFIGAIGIERSFIIRPRGVELRLPSDLVGVTFADYESARDDGEISSAMISPCTKIKTEIGKQGVLNRDFISSNNTIVSNPKNYEISELDMKVMAACLESRTSSPEGVTFFEIAKGMDEEILRLRLSSVKLQRMGFVEIELQIIEHNNGQEEYLGHKITELGVDYLLANEDRLNFERKLQSSKVHNTASEFDDEIPF